MTQNNNNEREAFAIADKVIKEAYQDFNNKGNGWWGDERIPNYGILRGAIAKAIREAQSPISQNEQQEAGSTLEDWLTINMPSGTFIGDPLWWARKIRNVLAFTENNKQAIPAVNVSVPYELLKRIMDNSEEIIFNDFVHVAVQFEIFSDLEDIFDNAAPTTSLTSETNTEVVE